MKMNINTGISRFFSSRIANQNDTEHPEKSEMPKRAVLMWLILLATLFGPLYAQAANHYVRQGATGSANGNDWTNAYTSLPSTLVRGDTYYIAGGSYPGKTFNTANSGTNVITIKKAIESDHGTATGWQSSYGTGQAAFTGMFEFTTSYWIIDGQTGGGVGSWDSNFGFKITEKGDANAIVRIGYTNSGIGNITIKHMDFQGKGSVSNTGGYNSNDGMGLYTNVHDVTVSYAWMHGIGRCPFFFGDNVSNTVIEYLYVQSYFASDPVHSEIMSSGAGSNTVGDTTFRYNLVTDIQGTGGLMFDNESSSSSHLWVYGNVFYKPAGASWGGTNGVIGGWTGNNGEGMHNVIVNNNTFININIESLSSFPNKFSGSSATNNIFYNCASPNFAKFPTHDYNYFINSGGTHSEAHGTSATSGDPFVNYAGLDFRLKANTNSGSSLPSPYNIDPLGTVRGVNGTYDRGAYQFNGNSSNLTLLPPTNFKSM
jgi:hypothetical protein